MEIKTISDFRAAIRNGPYTDLGGYPLFFIMADGGAISYDAAKAEKRQILEELRAKASGMARDYIDSGWLPVAFDINFEDSELTCDHTNERIPSAYGDD